VAGVAVGLRTVVDPEAGKGRLFGGVRGVAAEREAIMGFCGLAAVGDFEVYAE